jgi:hypothetical protein
VGANIGAQMLLGLLFFKSPFLPPHLVKSGELGRQKYPPEHERHQFKANTLTTRQTPTPVTPPSTVLHAWKESGKERSQQL